MGAPAEAPATKAELVTIDYKELCVGGPALLSRIEQAYGAKGLGILTVANVPDLPLLRARLLPLAAEFAALPEDVQRRYEDPASSYNFGWSHGRESLAGGQPDRHKGSFYANPLADEVACSPEEMAAFPTYCRSNVWPERELPQLRSAFRDLGQLIIQVGLLLCDLCDAYLSSRNPRALPHRLRDTVAHSPCPKGRLLHYYPAGPAGMQSSDSSWCGWHTDHGSLTGLTSALYLRDGQPAACPDPAAGLYIRDRHGAVVQAGIPPDHLAFQVGESMQVHSGGLLRATPHFVKGPALDVAAGISRNTFAVFMQPRWDEPMDVPEGMEVAAEVGVGQWRAGLTFGEFTELTMRQYYR